jgi:hypothetical protein
MRRPSRPSAAKQTQQPARSGGSAPIAAPVAAAIARDPRLRAALSTLDASQRDHVRRAIAAAIEAKLGPRGGQG